MKVAIVHDYIKEFGGAEKVLLALSEMFPDAPIYTSLYLPNFLGPHKERFETLRQAQGIKTSFLQYVPFKHKLLSPFRIISPLAFWSFDLSKYDTIIVSQTGAYFPHFVRKGSAPRRQGSPGQAKQFSYTHTPPRYLYGYRTAREWQKNVVFKVVGGVANHVLRMVDYYSSKRVDQFIANSEEVAARIKKFYRRESVVVYPPVDTPHELRMTNNELRKRTYYLTGGRLARAKGTDVIIDAFLQLDKPLKIFGRGFAGFQEELESRIKNSRSIKSSRDRYESREKNHNSSFVIHNSNIEFVGEVTDEEKFELMHNAKAFIFASYDEDFGITPVEANAVGTPVIAYRSGGVKETIIDSSAGSEQVATGVFYDENTPEKLIEAIKKFERLKISSKECITQAEKFSKERFQDQIKKIIV